MFSEYQQTLRERFLAAPVTQPPDPWHLVFDPYSYAPVGGLLGVGFALDPVSGNDLIMVVSSQGRGVFDAKAIATSSDLTLLARPPRHGRRQGMGDQLHETGLRDQSEP